MAAKVVEDKEAELIAVRYECADKVQQAQTAMDEMTANMKVRLQIAVISLHLTVQL